MSNTTSIGDRAICEELSCVQLGSASKPVQTAYINNVIPLPVGNLQQVCDLGNTTTTAVIASALIANGSGGVEASNGDIVASIGDVLAGDKITAGTTLIAGTGITSTAGDITAVAGDIVATAGKITSGANMNCGTTLEVGTGITCTLNDIVATAGGFLAGAGNSLFNRIQYTTFYGGTTAGAPLAVAPQSTTPLRVFTMPSNTYQLTVYLTNSQPAAQEFSFEVHGLPTFVLRDYQLHMTAQTYENGGGFSLGFNGIVIGESISDPTNTTKCTCVFNTAQPYASQKIKCNVRFEYSPSPP